MRIDTSGQGVDVTPAIKEYARLRVGDAVGLMERFIETVAVRLVKSGGEKAAQGVRCRIVAHFPAGPPVCAEVSDAGPHPAIDGAAARIGRALAGDARGARPSRLAGSRPSRSTTAVPAGT